MDPVSQIAPKNSRKYNLVDRTTQAALVAAAKVLPEAAVAQKYNVPRSTLQHWIARKEKLKGTTDPAVVDFLESEAGQAFLHKLVLGAILIFHKHGNCGLPALHRFFEMTELDKFVGSSIQSLNKTSQAIDQAVLEFEKTEVERLARNMPHKTITGAVDENFIMDEMTLILMDPVSGYILAEELAEKRDAETWHKVSEKAIQTLKVTLHHLVGDEASGLKKLAGDLLGITKGPDLFHVQQEITKGLTSHLGREIEQRKKREQELPKEKAEVLEKFTDRLLAKGGLNKLSKRDFNTGLKTLELDKEEKVNKKKLEQAEQQYKEAQEARREITKVYHPFNLDTGSKQTAEEVEKKLEQSYTKLEELAEKADCSDKQKKKLEKAKSSLKPMLAVLRFFYAYLLAMISFLKLDEVNGKVFENVVAIEYLKLCLTKAKKAKQKEEIVYVLQKLTAELEQDPVWGSLNPAVRDVWRRKALECAQVFQRSSSCVEGRNGQLSLKFHAFRRMNQRTLKVFTILHNFFTKRLDGTTAAERFFEQKPRDLEIWLLDRIELPRPRKKHRRQAKVKVKSEVAA